MDGTRFDQFTRVFSTLRSRREALRLLVASAGAAAIGSRLQRDVHAQACRDYGFPCVDGVNDCCGGLICTYGACYSGCEFGVPDDECESNDDCCGSLACVEGYCAKTCAWETESCEVPGTKSNCCGYLRCSGDSTCQLCSVAEGACTSDGDCCPNLGLTCDTGSGMCVTNYETACETDIDCVPSAGAAALFQICCNDVCRAQECCDAEDGTQGHCADGFICSQTVCAVVEEPQCQVASDCVAGAVGEGEPLCCDGTCALGECCVDGDCTDGTNGACVDNLCVYGAGCATDNDCIPAVGEAGIPPICCEGVCVSIECCMADEQTNPRCPVGTACFEGVCDPVCKGDGDCANGTCCCPDGSCDAGCCAPVDNGNENEQPTKLPSTGSGQDDRGNGLLLGAALLGGAAAVLGGKKLREQSEE